jgi:hypothetical protein
LFTDFTILRTQATTESIEENVSNSSYRSYDENNRPNRNRLMA